MALTFIQFIACTAVIFFAGQRVAKYGDVIAEKTGLGGLWIGVVLLSVATSLPELFTGVGSTVFLDAPDLTVGNLFGANMYNLVNIALLDVIHRGGPLLSAVSGGQLLTAALSLFPLAVASAGILLSARLPEPSFAQVSVYGVLVAAAYLVSARRIFSYEKRHRQQLEELNREERIIYKYAHLSLKKASVRYVFFALLIVGSGIWLSYIGDDLARILHLKRSFIGSLFLGFATTLPEITVSVAALRLGAREMAVANMLGSNLFNMSIIFVNDLLYRKSPIFSAVSEGHLVASFAVVLMTATVMIGMVEKPRRRLLPGVSGYALLLVALFLAGMYGNAMINNR